MTSNLSVIVTVTSIQINSVCAIISSSAFFMLSVFSQILKSDLHIKLFLENLLISYKEENKNNLNFTSLECTSCPQSSLESSPRFLTLSGGKHLFQSSIRGKRQHLPNMQDSLLSFPFLHFYNPFFPLLPR